MLQRGTLPEILRALCVLVLIFLNFAHQPAMASAPSGDVLTVLASQSFCGAPIADDKGHAPCHACRIGGAADLPPPCVLPPAPLAVAISLAGAPAALELALPLFGPAGARAPPAA